MKQNHLIGAALISFFIIAAVIGFGGIYFYNLQKQINHQAETIQTLQQDDEQTSPDLQAVKKADQNQQKAALSDYTVRQQQNSAMYTERPDTDELTQQDLTKFNE